MGTKATLTKRMDAQVPSYCIYFLSSVNSPITLYAYLSNRVVTDIDECSENANRCGHNMICENTRGNFSCSCSPGYYMTNGACVPIQTRSGSGFQPMPVVGKFLSSVSTKVTPLNRMSREKKSLYRRDTWIVFFRTNIPCSAEFLLPPITNVVGLLPDKYLFKNGSTLIM
jgi:hypothetical protein